jgi:hypothetical protein
MPYIPTSRPGIHRRNAAATMILPAQFAFGTMYNADAPREWFRSINAIFTVNHVTKSLTKFYWAISKQPAMLVDTC